MKSETIDRINERLKGFDRRGWIARWARVEIDELNALRYSPGHNRTCPPTCLDPRHLDENVSVIDVSPGRPDKTMTQSTAKLLETQGSDED